MGTNESYRGSNRWRESNRPCPIMASFQKKKPNIFWVSFNIPFWLKHLEFFTSLHYHANIYCMDRKNIKRL